MASPDSLHQIQESSLQQWRVLKTPDNHTCSHSIRPGLLLSGPCNSSPQGSLGWGRKPFSGSAKSLWFTERLLHLYRPAIGTHLRNVIGTYVRLIIGRTQSHKDTKLWLVEFKACINMSQPSSGCFSLFLGQYKRLLFTALLFLCDETLGPSKDFSTMDAYCIMVIFIMGRTAELVMQTKPWATIPTDPETVSKCS
jgi:hypothetical protein